MAKLIIAILLLAAGFVLVFLELTIPSFGIIGLLCAACFVAALILAFSHSVTAGIVFVGLLCIGVPFVLWLWSRVFPHTWFGRRMILQAPDSAPDRPGAHEDLKDAEGVAKTALRPSGIAVIDGRRVDVVTEGKIIETGSPVRVVDVTGNRIVVRRIPNETPLETDS